MINGKLASGYYTILCQNTGDIWLIITNYRVWLNWRRRKNDKYVRYSAHYRGGCWRRCGESLSSCDHRQSDTLLLWNKFAILYPLWKYLRDVDFVISVAKNLSGICLFISIFIHIIIILKDNKPRSLPPLSLKCQYIASNHILKIKICLRFIFA